MKPYKNLDWKEIKAYTVNLYQNIIRPLLIMLAIFFIGLILVALFSGCQEKNILEEYPEDNFIEEAVEYIIKDKTGMDVDLTPFSPEE